MWMSLVDLEGFTDTELHEQNLISVFTSPNRLQSDCIPSGTRMLLVCGHARTWSETILLPGPVAVPGCCSGWVPEKKLDKLALN